MRYIGVDLHTTQITVCYLTENGATENKQYRLEKLSEFCAELKQSDQLAVEATSNTAWFVAQVRGRVSRVVIVNPAQFQVIRRCGEENRQTRLGSTRQIFESRFAARIERKIRGGAKSAQFESDAQ